VNVVEGAWIGREVAIEGIGKRRIHWKPDRALRREDNVQTWVFAAWVVPDQRFVGQTMGGDGDQFLPLKSQETGRVAGDQTSQCGEKPVITVFGSEGSGQVPRDFQENLQALWLLLI
jgi:hypothetical protein